MTNSNIVSRLIGRLRSLIRAIFGRPETGRQTIHLNRVGAQSFTGEVDESVSAACTVRAVSEDTTPVGGVEVIFTVIRGPIQLTATDATGGTASDELTVETDGEGIAAVDATFSGEEYGVIAAELASHRSVSQFFDGRSAGVTHQVFIHGGHTFPADPGEVTLDITALDAHGEPVTGADIRFEGGYGADTIVEGEVTEVGNGVYRGRFQSHTAGEWNVTAYDFGARVQAEKTVHIEPDEPTTIRFNGPTDPLREEPYGEAFLRVELVDDFGNPHDSRRIRGELDGDELVAHSYSQTEARFRVAEIGYVDRAVTLTDRESDVSHTEEIQFGGVWMGDPGLVFEGETFTTPVYVLPPPERPVDHVEIDISFDPKRARFSELDVPQDGPRLETTVEAQEEMVTVTAELVEGEGLFASEYPNGIHVFDVQWECVVEGECCFQLVGRMSPETPGWELCVDQKRAREQCICVNVIYKNGDTAALQQGQDAADEVTEVISSDDNVARCCPVIEVEVEDCALTDDQWQKVVGAIGANETIDNNGEYRALYDEELCHEEECINLMMVDLNWNGWDGATYEGTAPGNDYGYGVIETGQVGLAENGNLGAHEIGHALDFGHQGSSGDNLMSEYAPHGDNLTADQCETVWRNLDNYPCE